MRLVDDLAYNIQGMGLLQEAKKLQPAAKAVILTGYPDSAQRDKALNFYKADGYFEKAPEGEPLDIDQFSRIVFSLLDKKTDL